MVMIPQTYNTADLPDGGAGMPLITPGQYQAVILGSEMVTTKTGTGQMLVFDVTITQGQYANTEFKERLNIINPNPQAVEIAYKTLARISEALGMAQTPGNSDLLHNKPLMIEIATEPGEQYTDKTTGVQKQGKDKSIISKYLALPAGGAPAVNIPATALTPATAVLASGNVPPAAAASAAAPAAAAQNAFVQPATAPTEAAAPAPANPFAAT